MVDTLSHYFGIRNCYKFKVLVPVNYLFSYHSWFVIILKIFRPFHLQNIS